MTASGPVWLKIPKFKGTETLQGRLCILAFLDQNLRGLKTLRRLKFYQICFPHSSKLLQATSGHPSLSQPSLSPPIPPSQKFVLLANKKLRLRIKIQLQAAGLNEFQSRISSVFWNAITLRTCHVNSESHGRDGKK